MANILIIDDEQRHRQMLARVLTNEGYDVQEAENCKNGIKLLDKKIFHVIFFDVKLPDGNGVELTKTIKEQHPETEIILYTAYGNISDGVKAIKNGAFDYLVKGDDNDKILPLLTKAVDKATLQFKIKELENKLSGNINFENIIGKSDEIKEVIDLAKKVAPTNATVLLTGETGAGKEMFAQSIHNASQRKGKPFTAINCSAFSREILESELFGHKAGSFTGALKDKKGLIEEANTGTLFLDEIGEMHADLQAKLLRVLENGEFLKVGDTKLYKVDVRVIAATNRNLREECNKGNFRLDLFYRLSAFQIMIPALNQRKRDIPLFADFFIQHYAAILKKRIIGMEEGFVEKLREHNWSGNVRELKNVIERACILANSELLKIDNLPFEFSFETMPSNNQLVRFSLQEIEKLHIQKVLEYTKGNKTKAAELLNIGLTTLYVKLKEYEL